jgi:hypothetical protein
VWRPQSASRARPETEWRPPAGPGQAWVRRRALALIGAAVVLFSVGLADLFGLSRAIGSVEVMTFASGAAVAGAFRETNEGQVAKEG